MRLGTTTIVIPRSLQRKLAALKRHPRQPYHEVITDLLAQGRTVGRAGDHRLDPLVERNRSAILAAAQRRGLKAVAVFGSRCRAQARPDSDLDLLVTPGPEADAFGLMAFEQEVEALVGVKVEATTPAGLHPLIKDQVVAEAVAL